MYKNCEYKCQKNLLFYSNVYCVRPIINDTSKQQKLISSTQRSWNVHGTILRKKIGTIYMQTMMCKL